MSEESEKILGEIPVISRLSLGSERLTLFPTTTRIIVAHVGKRGTGAPAMASFFGRLSGGIEDLFRSGKESLGKRRMESLTPKEILGLDKDNFAIGYEEIVRVEVEETLALASLTILTKDEKYKFSTRAGFERVVGLLEGILGPKLVCSRLPSREDYRC